MSGKSKTFRLVGLQVEEGTICDQPMNPEAKVVLFKRRPAQQEAGMPKSKTQKNAPEGTENTDPLKAANLTPEQEEVVQQAIEAAKQKALEEEAAKRKAAEEEPETEEPEEEKEAKKSLSKAQRELADLRKQLDTERTARLDREYLEKARGYSKIPVPSEKVGELMRAVATLEKSHGETLAQVLKACNELAATNTEITKSIGVANGVGKTGTAEEEIKSIVAKKMAADPDLDESTAIAKAWKENPKLVLQHREETAAKR